MSTYIKTESLRKRRKQKIFPVNFYYGIFSFILLFVKLYDITINRHEEMQERAARQQTQSTTISASRGTIYDRELFEMLRDAAGEKNIPWQTKQMVAGGTDAGRIHKSGAGVRTVGLAAPLRYIHSPSSVAAKCDLDCVLELAREFLERIGKED